MSQKSVRSHFDSSASDPVKQVSMPGNYHVAVGWFNEKRLVHYLSIFCHFTEEEAHRIWDEKKLRCLESDKNIRRTVRGEVELFFDTRVRVIV